MRDFTSQPVVFGRYSLPVWGANALVACVYFCAARVGLLLATIHGNVSPVWPASGFAVAVIWLGGVRLLPGVAIGVFAASAFTELALPAALGIAAGNCLEAWLGARLLRAAQGWFRWLHDFAEPAGFCAAAVVAPLTSASVGLACIAIVGGLPPEGAAGLWGTWWVGDALGVLLVGPVVQSLLVPGAALAGPPARWRLRAAGLLAAFVGLNAWGYGAAQGGPVLFLLFPLLVLVAYWFDRVGGRLAALGIAACALVALAQGGTGPFVGMADQERLALLELLVGATALAALVVPVLLSSGGRSLLPIWVLLGGWAMAGGAFYALQVQRARLDELHLGGLIADVHARIEQRFGACFDLVRSGASFVDAVPAVSKEQWATFVGALDLAAAYPEVTSMNVVRPVGAAQLATFTRARREEGFADFEVHAVPGGEDLAGTEQRERFVITRIEPLRPNRSALGLDLASEAVRRTALEAARRSAAPQVSGRLVLVQDAAQRPGFLIVFPLFPERTEAGGGSAPDAGCTGWVYAGFVAERFFGTVRGRNRTEIELAVYAGERPDPALLMYASAGVGRCERDSVYEIAGQRYTLCWTRGAAFRGAPHMAAAIVTASLMLVSLVFAGLVASLYSTGHRAKELAAERTGELQKAQEDIESLLERADCLLWDATVSIDGENWTWVFNVQPSGLYKRLFGVRRPTLEQGLWYQLNIPEQHEMDERSRAALSSGSSGYDQEFRVIDGNRTVWLREKVSLTALGGNRWRVAAVVTDVTQRRTAEQAQRAAYRDLQTEMLERKVAQEEAQRARAAAEDANHAKSEFLATMSHEIRTPMNSIIGFTDLLLESHLADEQREWVAIIRESGRSLLAIINDILDLSKIEAGKVELERIPFSPAGVVRDIVGLLAAGARKKGVHLELEVPAETPARVLGDPVRFRQVLLNLISNALKFTPAGAVRVVYSWQPAGETLPQGVLGVDVHDTGIGIAPDKVDRIFQKFTQADGATTRRFGGSGLGLSIAKRLIELMHGDIGVKSTPGEGSTFWFRLPLEVSDGDDPVPPVDPARAAAPPAPANGSGSNGRMHVLVADDVEFNQRLAMLMLRKLGCTVDFTGTGRGAVEKTTDARYDLVFMDCQMPEMDGFEATRTIRHREQAEGAASLRLPIVAMTASAVVGDREQCLAAGMDDYVTKPLEVDELRRVLVRWCGASTEPRPKT